MVSLGGGRRNPQDPIDPGVGLTRLCFPGEAVGPNQPLARVHARDLAQAEQAVAAVQTAYSIASVPFEAPALISRLCLEPQP